ncbi:MAG: TonB-dependent receptor [Ignavibacteriae bacterium]|nr:TonB-dependent receptor [Ignavibacteriota bacterium]
MKTTITGVFILTVFVLFCIETGLPQETVSEQEDTSLDSLLNMKVSTAAKYWQTSSEAPASVTIITSKQIERYGYSTLDDVLRSVRGFYTSYDRNYSYIGVRGFSRPTDYNDRLLLLLNGHTMNENVYGSMLAGNDLPIDLRSLDRIEIVRGPGSALYGTGAMFAVINLITKKGNDIDGINLSTEFGSYGKLGANVLYGKQFENALDVLFSFRAGKIQGQDLYYREYDSVQTNYGVAQNIDDEHFAGLIGSLQYKYTSLLVSFTNRFKRVPTAAFETIFNDPSFTSRDKRGLIELLHDYPFATDKNIMSRLYYDYYEYFGSYPYETMLNYDASTGKWYGGEVQFRWDVFPGNRFTIGTEFRNNLHSDYRNWTADSVFFDKNFPFNIFSLYLQNEFQVFENLSFTAGIRRDEYSTVGSATTPRLALIFNILPTSTLKMLYGEGFRSPNTYETNYEDNFSSWVQNTNLKPEKIITSEIAWEQRFTKDVFGVLSLYSYDMDELIDPVIDSLGISQFQNISDIHAQGIETELNFRTDIGLNGYTSFIYQKARDPLLDGNISNSPTTILRLGFSYQLVPSLTLSSEVRYTSERYTVNRTTTDPFIIANLNIHAKAGTKAESGIGKLLNNIECSLLVENIFNTSYATPGGIEHRQDAIPQDGRTFLFRIGYTL